ncbi:serine/threonine protein kinase [Seongchinamella sediminis]|uniref:Serine/threonine protein kinase n=1 Tax=Seongchinamella sediminis TaxID=2283635 RepID=A0A3L7DVS0_9GAMM|nr:serine/threonine-protein kinase [Seongchinamella sediminis]RLQ21206.1 serine/threonine protein kinase [Seongchinamella sediminis]
MTTQNWNELERLFNAAIDLDPADRAAFLARECEGRPELQAAVNELLANSASATDFAAVINATADDLLEHINLGGNDRVGPYRILRKIGQGGMGTVYLAERADDEYHQQVAIKVINHQPGRNDAIVQRFHAERQILANLQHPNITRLLDGGTLDNGSPFLVMEFVDGDRIDHYCASHGLSVDAILALFLKVCDAVQNAHQNLVIHRDLKPSNIAIDSHGEPKLMDFGVAKLMRTEADGADPQTVLEERALTPLYASPEQLSGEAVSTLSDLYSLGVILYELLAGQRPFGAADGGAYAYAQQVIETDPPSLSQNRKRAWNAAATVQAGRTPGRKISRDLDNIVLKALQRDPGRRYSSVAALAADIDNFLQHKPVSARPPSLPYLAQRFIQRNRLASALVLVSTLTVTGLGVALWFQADLAARERDIARDQLARTTAVLALVEDMFTGLDPDVSQGEDITVRYMLDEAGARMLRSEVEDQQAAPVRAVIYRIIGNTYNELGLADQALRYLDRAMDLHQSGLVADEDEKIRAMLAISNTYHLAFELDARLAVSTQALALSDQRYGAGDERTLEALEAVASANHMLGRLEQAQALFAEIYQRRSESRGEQHPSTLNALKNLGVVEHWLGNYAAALSAYTRCQELGEAAQGPLHSETLRCLGYRGLVLETMGDYPRAAPVLEEHAQRSAKVMGENHPDTLRSLHSLADSYRGLAQYDRAEALFLEVLDRRRSALGQDHIETLQTEMKLARVYRLTRRYDDAESLINHAVEEEVRQQGFEHPATLIAAQEKADLLLDSGQLTAARELLLRILAARTARQETEHPELQKTLVGLARTDLNIGEPAVAQQRLQRALQLGESRPDYQHRTRRQILALLVESSEGLNDASAAQAYRQRLALLDNPPRPG